MISDASAVGRPRRREEGKRGQEHGEGACLVRGLPEHVLSPTIWPSIRSHVSLFDSASLFSRRVRPGGPGRCGRAPRDVDDVYERMPHDVGEICTSAPHAQHEGAQLEHASHGHAQPAWAQACTCQRQTARVHRAHNTGTQACAARAHGAKTRGPRTARVRTGRAGGACTRMVHACHVAFGLCAP